MQEILTGVFLGPLQIARVNSTLHANKITLLIPVRTKDTARFLSIPNDENGQAWQAFPVDIQYDQIMSWFYPTYLRVKEEVDKGGRVFIYCENGNGLSAAMCVALVMDSKLYPPLSPCCSSGTWLMMVDGNIEWRESLCRENGIAWIFPIGLDLHLKYSPLPSPLIVSNTNLLWKRVHKLLGQKLIHDHQDDGTSMMSTKKNSVTVLTRSASLTGIRLPLSISDCQGTSSTSSRTILRIRSEWDVG